MAALLQKGKGAVDMAAVYVAPTNNGQIELNPSGTDVPNRPLIVKNAYAALMKFQNKAE